MHGEAAAVAAAGAAASVGAGDMTEAMYGARWGHGLGPRKRCEHKSMLFIFMTFPPNQWCSHSAANAQNAIEINGHYV